MNDTNLTRILLILISTSFIFLVRVHGLEPGTPPLNANHLVVCSRLHSNTFRLPFRSRRAKEGNGKYIMRFLGVYSTPTLPIATHTPLKPFETAYPLANSEKYTWAFLGANLLLAKPNSFGPFPLISMSVSEKQLLGSGFGSWGCENTLFFDCLFPFRPALC